MKLESAPREPLSDEDWEVRDAFSSQIQRAKRTLDETGIIQAIVDQEDIPIPVASYLAKCAKTPSLRRLLLKHEDPEVRYVVCIVLLQIKRSSAREELLITFFDEVEYVRAMAIEAYTYVGRNEDGPVILAALRLEQSPAIQRALVTVLGEIQYQPALSILAEYLRNETTRMDAISALGHLAGADTLKTLKAELEDELDPSKHRWIRRMIELVQARNDRATYESLHREPMPRRLTAAEIDRLLAEPPSTIASLVQYIAIHSEASEILKVKRNEKDGKNQSLLDSSLELVKIRDKRGF